MGTFCHLDCFAANCFRPLSKTSCVIPNLTNAQVTPERWIVKEKSFSDSQTQSTSGEQEYCSGENAGDLRDYGKQCTIHTDHTFPFSSFLWPSLKKQEYHRLCSIAGYSRLWSVVRESDCWIKHPRNRKWHALLYITWCKHEREFGKIPKFKFNLSCRRRFVQGLSNSHKLPWVSVAISFIK